MSKKKENITGASEDPVALPVRPPRSERTPDIALDPPPPHKFSRFGSGEEGAAVRKERAGGAAPGFFTRAAEFLHDVRLELRRVSWPTGSEVYKTTLITIIAVIFFAVYLFAVDRVWALFVDQLDRLLNMLTGAA